MNIPKATDDQANRADIKEVTGPIVVAREIRVNASPEAIWAVLTAFARWPEWNPDVSKMGRPPALVAPGYEFRWKAGPSQIRSTLLDLQPHRRIVWEGRTMSIRAVHMWELAAYGDHTVIHTEESYSGLVAKLFRSPLTRTLEAALTRGLESLKHEVEAPVGHQAEAEPS